MINKKIRLPFIFTLSILLLISSATVFAYTDTEVMKKLSGDVMPQTSMPLIKIKFTSTGLTKTGECTATFKYKLLDKTDADITKEIPASRICAVSSEGSPINLDPSTGTGTITFKSSVYIDDVIITLLDKISGISATLYSESSLTKSNSNNLSVYLIDFISDMLTKTGENTATFKYKLLDKAGTNITKEIPATRIGAISSEGWPISLDTLTGTGTIIFNSSANLDNVIITFWDKVGGKCNIFIPKVLPIDKIEFISTKLTKTKENTAVFQYKLLSKTGVDITKEISASRIGASSSEAYSSIKLDPLTGTGTITFRSSANIDNSTITLFDKTCGLSARLHSITKTLSVVKINFFSDKLTKTGENTSTFKYQVLSADGSDITKQIPASRIHAVSSEGSPINLDPSTGTGTITFKSSTNINNVIITLSDNITGVGGTLVVNP